MHFSYILLICLKVHVPRPILLKECVNIECSLNLAATMWASASVFLLLVHGTASKPQYGQVS